MQWYCYYCYYYYYYTTTTPLHCYYHNYTITTTLLGPFYCSRDHQISHWKGGHKTECSGRHRNTAAGGGAPGVWPESLLVYVERSLTECGSDKAAVEAYLKKRIEGAVARDALNDIDWAAEPLAYIALAKDKEKSEGRRGGTMRRGPMV